MIVSHKHQYIFLETPRTASSAIKQELIDNYGGERYLYKHANYNEIPRMQRKKMSRYTVFAGVRDPLNSAVSKYQKIITNHNEVYTDPKNWLENGGWVSPKKRRLFKLLQGKNSNFLFFLKQVYPYPYTSRLSVNEKYCHFIIRYEHLQSDFDAVLARIGLKKLRDVPLKNKTSDKKPYMEYFDESQHTRDHIARIFGPFMKRWGYFEKYSDILPEIRKFDELNYAFFNSLNIAYFRLVRATPLGKIKGLRSIVE